MAGFMPAAKYIKAMKDWGILSADYEWGGYEDMFKTDHAYWDSLHYRPRQASR